MEALITPSVPQTCPSLQLQACGEVAKWRPCATRAAEVPLPPGMLAGFVGPEQCNPGPCQLQQQGAGSDSDVSVTDASATDVSATMLVPLMLVTLMLVTMMPVSLLCCVGLVAGGL